TPFWKKFFAWIPALLLCYFVPAVYNTVGLIDGAQGAVYNPIGSRALLPVALVLLTMTLDLKGVLRHGPRLPLVFCMVTLAAGLVDGAQGAVANPIGRRVLLPVARVLLAVTIDLKGGLRLGPRLLFVFCMGTLGIALGAIVSFQLFEWLKPDVVAGDVWMGMAALAGSWIGGGANMVAIREVYGVDATLFGQFAVVDVAIANLWMATLLFLAGRAATIDARSGADTRAIDEMKSRLEAHEAANARIPTLTDLMMIIGIGFGI